MGLLDFLGGGDTPQYTPPKMSQPLQDSISGQEGRAANTSAQDYTDKLNSGVQTQAQQTTSGQNGTNLGGSGDMGMSQAIQNKQNKSFSQSLSQLQTKNSFQGLMMQHQQTENAANLSVQLTGIQRGIASQVAQYQTQADATRYAIINGLMSGAGSIGGAMMANSRSSKQANERRTRENAQQSVSIGGDEHGMGMG
jgi:hypothetical protein